MNEIIPDSSGMGHATAEITRKAEGRGMGAGIIIKGGTDYVLVYNTVRTRVAPCIHAPRDERELDQGRRCARIPVIFDSESDVTRESISVWR